MAHAGGEVDKQFMVLSRLSAAQSASEALLTESATTPVRERKMPVEALSMPAANAGMRNGPTEVRVRSNSSCCIAFEVWKSPVEGVSGRNVAKESGRSCRPRFRVRKGSSEHDLDQRGAQVGQRRAARVAGRTGEPRLRSGQRVQVRSRRWRNQPRLADTRANALPMSIVYAPENDARVRMR